MHCTPVCNLSFMNFLNKPKNKCTDKSLMLIQEQSTKWEYPTSINSCNLLQLFKE